MQRPSSNNYMQVKLHVQLVACTCTQMCTKNLANTRPGTCSFGLTKKWGFIILSSRCIKLQSSSRLLSCICAPKKQICAYRIWGSTLCFAATSLNTSVLWHVSSHFIYPISLCSNSADRIPCRNDFALAFVICFFEINALWLWVY